MLGIWIKEPSQKTPIHGCLQCNCSKKWISSISMHWPPELQTGRLQIMPNSILSELDAHFLKWSKLSGRVRNLQRKHLGGRWLSNSLVVVAGRWFCPVSETAGSVSFWKQRIEHCLKIRVLNLDSRIVMWRRWSMVLRSLQYAKNQYEIWHKVGKYNLGFLQLGMEISLLRGRMIPGWPPHAVEIDISTDRNPLELEWTMQQGSTELFLHKQECSKWQLPAASWHRFHHALLV